MVSVGKPGKSRDGGSGHASQGQASMIGDVNQLLEYVKSAGRVCPLPEVWTRLWEILPDRKQYGAGWEPPLPLILAAWYRTSDADKRDRLVLHIQYAAKHGVINQVESLLTSLPPDQWVYEGEV